MSRTFDLIQFVRLKCVTFLLSDSKAPSGVIRHVMFAQTMQNIIGSRTLTRLLRHTYQRSKSSAGNWIFETHTRESQLRRSQQGEPRADCVNVAAGCCCIADCLLFVCSVVDAPSVSPCTETFPPLLRTHSIQDTLRDLESSRWWLRLLTYPDKLASGVVSHGNFARCDPLTCRVMLEDVRSGARAEPMIRTGLFGFLSAQAALTILIRVVESGAGSAYLMRCQTCWMISVLVTSWFAYELLLVAARP